MAAPAIFTLIGETADFVYLRFHGEKSLYGSCYSETSLKKFATLIVGWLEKGLIA